ncbi:Release factor glutamine methyltransferase [Candidatus Tiddalikarchaeum anstoanum]|nr:Release factor glutamine methyltransferase [Candidatus Tiddalikarchaeum anstoanum]
MVYEASEDSFLLQKWVERLCPGKSVLDMGTGTGIQAVAAAKSGARRVVGLDIDKNAIEQASIAAKLKGVNVDFRVSDLFSGLFEGETFDIIIFNPPYLPADERLQGDIDLTGGETGNELTIRFLKEAKKFLTRSGFLLVICSSISNPFGTFNEAKNMGYEYEILEELGLALETLYCVKFTSIRA